MSVDPGRYFIDMEHELFLKGWGRDAYMEANQFEKGLLVDGIVAHVCYIKYLFLYF